METINLDKRMPWEQEHPISWSEFLASVERLCQERWWQIDYDSIQDYSCVIFARPEQEDEETIAGQEFTQDELPF